jgi:hypothetical protein
MKPLDDDEDEDKEEDEAVSAKPDPRYHRRGR